MPAERVARLAGGDDEDRAVGVGKIIDAAIARAMHIQKRVRPGTQRNTALQGEIPARGRLPDIHQMPDHRHLAQNLVSWVA